MTNAEQYISQVLSENVGELRVPIVKERRDLVFCFYHCIFDEEKEEYDIDTPHYHDILDAYEISLLGGNSWCKNGYIWEGLVLRCQGIYKKTIKGTIHNFLFLGSLSERNIVKTKG
jgi:hypothetical protein